MLKLSQNYLILTNFVSVFLENFEASVATHGHMLVTIKN